MPPVAEVDPAQRRIGLERTTAAALAVAGTLAVSTSEAVADSPNRVEIEKQALAAFGSTALTRTIDSEPVASDSANETLVPGPDGLVDADASQATASDLQQDCVRAALRKPKIISVMSYPGDKRKQSIGTQGRFNPTSAACLPLISRGTPRVYFRMKRQLSDKQRLTRTKAQELKNDDNQPIGNEAGSGTAFVTASGKGGMRDRDFLYRCSDRGMTIVQAVYTLRVSSAVDGGSLGKKTYTSPVKIRSVPKFAPVQAEVLEENAKTALLNS